MEALKAYAQKHNLYVGSGLEDVLAQADMESGGDLGPLEGVTMGLFYPDHTVMQCVVVVKGGELYHFGWEVLKGQDPGVLYPITLQELESLGDPRKLF